MVERKASKGTGKSTRTLLVVLLIITTLSAAVYAVLDRKRITAQLSNTALENGRFDLAEALSRLGGHSVRTRRFLEKAIEIDDAERVIRYLEAGADPDGIAAAGKPMVYLAAENGAEAALEVLAARGANLDYHPEKRNLPLLLMANRAKSRQAFRLLLKHGSDPNVISDYGYPLVYICLRQKQYAWFDLLVARGADLSYISPTRRSLADDALWTGHEESIALLLDKGIPVMKTRGESNELNEAARVGDVRTFIERLEAGDSPYLRDGYDLNALETAIWSQSPSCVNALLEAGVDPNVPFGAPLRAAVKKGNLALVNLLLENGAQPDAREKTVYRTALHEAVCRSLPIVQTLVAHGADVNATHASDHKTPLWWAINCGEAETKAFLETHGGQYKVYKAWYRMGTPFERAAADGDIKEMARMLAAGHYINERDAFGDTAFHYAAAGGSVAAMQFLKEHGGLPMFRGALTRTPLFWAAFHGRIEACRYLLKNGCRLVDRDAFGETPLHFAAKGNQVEAVKLFIALDADVDANVEKDSPLAEAAGDNAAEAVRLLIEHGAAVNAHGGFGRTALHRAVLRGGADAVAVLLELGGDIHAGDKQGISPLDFVSAYRDQQGNSAVYVQMMAASGKPVRPGFDCTRAATTAQQLICADMELAEMSAAAHRATAALENSGRRAAEQYLEAERQKCVFSPYHYPEDKAFYKALDCLKTVYRDHLQELKRVAP